MIKHIFPQTYAKSVFDIDYQQLYQKGYHAIIFDIDATLVPHGRDITPEVEQLFDQLVEIGFSLFLLSNNSDERIRHFTRTRPLPYIPLADKPNPAAYHKAVKQLQVKPKEVVVVGDQIFTDILGANRAGLDNIMVQFIPQENETKLGKKRRLEKLILAIHRLFSRQSYSN
ncbi:YqeG family HAD IIIA-type phosphatase [Streptococcus hyointestinalis]|uniref:YqeG family HAD IIIA-type phosphatase n=1 Tax=Streptococcus hyointestinalis TaxID=1337 RepID=UPI003D06537E